MAQLDRAPDYESGGREFESLPARQKNIMFEKLSNKQKGTLLAFIGVMIITPDALIIRSVSVETWDLLFYRSLLPGLALLVGYFIFLNHRALDDFMSIGVPGLINALLVLGANVTFVMALANTDVANALIMISLVPIIAAIFSFIFLNEKPEIITWFCSFGCLLAVIFIFYESYELNKYLGDFYGLLCAIFVGASLTVMRGSPEINFVPSYILGKLATAVLSAFFVSTFVIGIHDLLLISLMIITVGVSFVFISIAPQYISSPEVGIFFLLETSLGPLWVWLFIFEEPTQKTLIGGILIILLVFGHSYYMIKKENIDKVAL